MIEKIKKVLLELGLDKISRKIFKIFFWKRRLFMKFPPYGDSFQKYILSRLDPVRYESIALALNTIEKQKLDGAIAEVGVYRGETSKVINKFVSNKKIYLFDTFAGFPENDLEVDQDDRFRDTNIELVKKNIGDCSNIEFKPGYFPESAIGIEDSSFCFVLLDLDLFKSTIAALNYFYPKMIRGGYIFIHDYNNPESNYAISRALKEFMFDKPELIVELPDVWGSAMFRKI